MNREAFRARYGPAALVLGGSEGIGAAFAWALAARGLDVVVAALPGAPLGAIADAIPARHAVRVRPVPVDLAEPGAVALVAEACADLEVGCVVYNAGVSRVGPFLEVPLATHARILALNCGGPLAFVHRFAPPMVARGRGGIVLLASMAGLQGAPWLATYAATKAFDLVLAESLWAELAPARVDVLAVVAGATRTPGWIAAGAARARSPVMEPEAVAEEALRALGRGGPTLVPGWRNRLATAFLRALPRRWATRAIASATRAMREAPPSGAAPP